MFNIATNYKLSCNIAFLFSTVQHTAILSTEVRVCQVEFVINIFTEFAELSKYLEFDHVGRNVFREGPTM